MLERARTTKRLAKRRDVASDRPFEHVVERAYARPCPRLTDHSTCFDVFTAKENCGVTELVQICPDEKLAFESFDSLVLLWIAGFLRPESRFTHSFRSYPENERQQAPHCKTT